MKRYQVTKTMEFCYGHRLLNHDGKCRFLHGHNGMLEIDVDAEVLDHMGMVIDFSRLSDIVKVWVNENLDHRMLLQRNDPLVRVLTEAGEPVFTMDENPTAENIAALIWRSACEAGLQVSEVRLWETATSRASFRCDPPWNE